MSSKVLPVGAASLVELLGRGRPLVLTGAGISTDSGIPDYRGADGRLRHARPMTYERFCSSAAARRRYWARSHLGWPRIAGARPNLGHRVLAGWQREGRLAGLVTQNVDGLHQAAGSAEVVDLHGRLDTVVCLDCRAQRPRLEIDLRLEVVNPGFRAALGGPAGGVRPDGDVALDEEAVARFRVVACRGCGGVLKPDVVFFGEHVPRARFRGSLGRLEDARSLLVLGSSLAVGSGYRFVTAARRRGLPVAIVTRGPTRADHLADVRVDGELSHVLGEVAAALS